MRGSRGAARLAGLAAVVTLVAGLAFVTTRSGATDELVLATVETCAELTCGAATAEQVQDWATWLEDSSVVERVVAVQQPRGVAAQVNEHVPLRPGEHGWFGHRIVVAVSPQTTEDELWDVAGSIDGIDGATIHRGDPRDLRAATSLLDAVRAADPILDGDRLDDRDDVHSLGNRAAAALLEVTPPAT